MSLKEPTLKMSKSHKDTQSRININDSPEEIMSKINMALTDSFPGISYDPITRPGVSNLLELLYQFDMHKRSIETLVQECNGLSLREFKAKVALAVIDGLSAIRDRYISLVDEKNDAYLDSVANAGAAEARRIAQGTMAHVRGMVGL